MFTILYLGDIVGKLGRKAVQTALPDLKMHYKPDLVIGNVENLTHGVGISPKAMREMLDAGVNAFTSGNHIWGNPEGTPLLDDAEWKLVRPANVPASKKGRGSIVLNMNGVRVLLINLMGSLFTTTADDVSNAFPALDDILKTNEGMYDVAFVDMHAELTAEKEALGHYADGRVAAVIGSHTHVPTADAKILPGGTAYCTDAGRVGAYTSVLGFEPSSVINRFLTGERTPYTLPDRGKAELNGVVITADPATGKAVTIVPIRNLVEC